MDGEIGRLDEKIRPDASHQVLLGDQLTRPFKQNNQNFESATAKRDRLAAVQQEKLGGAQAERSEENFSWPWVGRPRKDWSVGIGTLDLVCTVKFGFDTKS